MGAGGVHGRRQLPTMAGGIADRSIRREYCRHQGSEGRYFAPSRSASLGHGVLDGLCGVLIATQHSRRPQHAVRRASAHTSKMSGPPAVRPTPTGYRTGMTTRAVAASGQIIDDDGIRRPAGDVHAWMIGTNQSVCGLALSRSGLRRFPHVSWSEVYAVTGGNAEGVQRVCPRCAAAAGSRTEQRWTRRDPRP